MKIAILYICTGKYSLFFNSFYSSCENYFFKDISHKTYFIFTDSDSIKNSNNIKIYYRECRGFPADSLFRFDLFLEIENEMLGFNYVFFFNANMLFVKPVGLEILPSINYQGLICVLHPSSYKFRHFPMMYTYERNKKSLAYVPFENKKYYYFMGGFNGGSIPAYFNMVRTCSHNIKKDLENNIIAIYHDESHLNKYCNSKNVHILTPAYGYPEGKKLPFDPFVIIRNKELYDAFFKLKSNKSIIGRLKKAYLYIYNAIIWYF
jgi:hypothetical protein